MRSMRLRSGLHRRDLDRHQHDPQPWSLPDGRTPADGHPAPPSQGHQPGCRPVHDRRGRADGARRPINGDWFKACVAQVLVPELQPGDVAFMDNLSSHKRTSVRNKIRASGATLHFLPPYSTDVNPIQKACSRLKAAPRKASE